MDVQEQARSLFAEGLARYATGRYAEAEHCFARSLALVPGRVSTLANLAATLIRLRRLPEAKHASLRALELDASCAPALLNLGIAEREEGHPSAALARFDAALHCRPQYAEAWINKAAALNDLGRHGAALDCCAAAVRLDDRIADAWFNQGVALAGLGEYAQAVDAYAAALSRDPRHGPACQNRGAAFERLHRLEEALQAYEQARQIDPHLDYLAGAILHARMQLCDWRDFDADVHALCEAVRREERATPPFALLALTDDAALLRTAAAAWCRSTCGDTQPLPVTDRAAASDRIRLGYFSADFHDHATAHLMAGLFEEHDGSRFERIAFSFGPARDDTMRRRLVAAFDDFIDVRTLDDDAVARLARARGIDIAIDLKGYTEDARPGIFAHRAAPVQVSYLGYPGTMSAGFMDYIVADAQVVAPGQESGYTERIVTLPGSYQINDRWVPVRVPAGGRSSHGLRPQAFVFCCFNKPYKITPHCFATWMRILAHVKGSVLWLLADHPAAAANLQHRARQCGIAADRLIFAPRLPVHEHLARHALADLFLDTLPYNAHTTASDALRAGLPVLTRRSRHFPGRVAASLLHDLQMDTLVVDTPQQYEARAIELAGDPRALAELRRGLLASAATAALFDPRRFARRLEQAYLRMHDRHRAGLPPDHLVIADASASD